MLATILASTSFGNFFESIFNVIGNSSGLMFGIFGALGVLVAYGLYYLITWIIDEFF